MKSGHQGNLKESEAVRCRRLVRRLVRCRRRMSLVLAGKRTVGELLSVLSVTERLVLTLVFWEQFRRVEVGFGLLCRTRGFLVLEFVRLHVTIAARDSTEYPSDFVARCQ